MEWIAATIFAAFSTAIVCHALRHIHWYPSAALEPLIVMIACLQAYLAYCLVCGKAHQKASYLFRLTVVALTWATLGWEGIYRGTSGWLHVLPIPAFGAAALLAIASWAALFSIKSSFKLHRERGGRSALLHCALCLIISAGIASNAGRQLLGLPSPRLFAIDSSTGLPLSSIALGNFDPGEKRVCSIYLRNATLEPITVVGMRSSCSCLSSQKLPTILQPGDGSLDVKIVAPRDPGRIALRTAFYFQEETVGEAKVKLDGLVPTLRVGLG